MITLTAKISLNIDDIGALSSVSTNYSKNNISGEIEDILFVKKQTQNAFILGSSKLGQGSTFSERVNYFIGKELSGETDWGDDYYTFSNPYEIQVSGSNINFFNIAFDTINNRHPKSVRVTASNGVSTVRSDDDPIFNLSNLNYYNSYTVTIGNWNTPNAPLIITGIYTTKEILIDKQNLVSLAVSLFDRSDYKLPSYGVISNTGDIEFNDFDGEILDYAKSNLLTSDLAVEINLKDTLSNMIENVAMLETKEWQYDNDNKSVSVSLKDELEEWQDIQIEGFSYDPRNPNSVLENGSMANLYDWLYAKTPRKYKMLSFNELDEATRNILSKTIIDYPLLNDGTLWQQWQKLCEVCALYIYKNNEGKTVCSYTLGS